MILTIVKLSALTVIVGLAWYFKGGIGDVENALKAAGWVGVAAVSAWHVVPVALCGLAWRSVLLEHVPGATFTFILSRWVRDGVGEILAFMPLSGEVMGARLLNRRGVPYAAAGAVTVVDLTAEILAQVVFSIVGVSMWFIRNPDGDILGWSLVGVGLTIPMLAGLIIAQRMGLVKLLEKLADKVMPEAWKAPGTVGAIHDAIVAIYGDRRRFLWAVAIHLVAWFVAVGEAWLALHLLGAEVSVMDVLALESVIFAIRNAVFFVPGALGVQEGAYVLIGAALGLTPEVALAVSLLKRAREVVLGVPAVITWQLAGRRSRIQPTSPAS